MRREELCNQREATFERIISNAPATFSAAQLRVLLRALLHLDFYTFADDPTEGIAEEEHDRSTRETLLAALDTTADDRLSAFAVRLALSGHRGIPQEDEPDFLSEAEAVFAPPSATPRKNKPKKPTLVKVKPARPAARKKTAA